MAHETPPPIDTDEAALRAAGGEHLAAGTLRTWLRALPPPPERGAFERVASLRGCLAGVDPTGRFVLTRRGQWTFAAHDSEEGFAEVTRVNRLAPHCALHPDGVTIASMWPGGSVVVIARQDAPHRTLYHGPAPDWDGRHLAPGEAPHAQWGHARASLSFVGDGAYLIVAAYLDQRACAYLYETEGWTLVDTLDAPAAFAPDASWHPQPYTQQTWGELWAMDPDPLHPTRVYLASNAGDSFHAFHAWGVAHDANGQNARLVELDALAISRQLFTRLGGVMTHVSGQRDGSALLIQDRDALLNLYRWPDGEPLARHLDPTAPLRRGGYDVRVWPEDEARAPELTLGSSFVARVDDAYTALPIVDYFDYHTHAVLLVDPPTMTPLGVTRPPRTRTPAELLHLRGDLFCTVSKTRTQLWRLRL